MSEGSYEDVGGDSDCEAISGPLDVKPVQVRELVRLTQEARHPYGKIMYADTLELKDNEGKAFLALEDKDMIRWLGREQFIKILRTFPIGWVNGFYGGDKGTLLLYKCTMNYTRYKC